MKTKTNQKSNAKIIKFEELSWKQIEKMPNDKTIFFLPISPMEEHGPHLPVGTDFLTIRDTTTEAIKTLKKEKPELIYVLLPAIPLGYCKFNIDFPGSISISGKAIKEIVYSVGLSLAIHGFKYLVIFGIFIGEGIFLGVLSWVLAVPLSYPGARVLSDALGMVIANSALEFEYSFSSVDIWLVIVAVLSALASVGPTWQATRVSVREALAYE